MALAAAFPHSGDWLHVGLRLSDEAHRLGCKACEPHTCPCGKTVVAQGVHGLSAVEVAQATASSPDEHPVQGNQMGPNTYSQRYPLVCCNRMASIQVAPH